MKMSAANETNNNDKNRYGGGGLLALGRQAFTTEVDFNAEWEEGVRTMRRLLGRKNVSQKEWQALFFTNSQITCWATNGCELLFSEFKREIHRHVTERAESIFQHTATNVALGSSGNGQDDSLDLLRRYVAEWDNYWVLCQYLPLPFNFIEKEDMQLRRTRHGGGGTQRRRLPQHQPKLFDLGGGGGGVGPNGHAHPPQLVRDAMLECWNRTIFDKLSDRLLSAAMHLVERERQGELIDQRLVVGVRQSFVELNVDAEQPLERYTRYFEQLYIDRAEAFYRDRAREVFEAGGTLAYMQYADEKLVEEERRAKLYLHSTPEYESESLAHQNQLITANRFLKESANLASKQTTSVERLLTRCVQVLVIGYEDRLLERADRLITEREIDRLRQLYRLMNRTPTGISTLLSQLAAHISREGTAAMRSNAGTITRDSEKFVEQLLSMYTHFSTLVHDAFYNDSRFLTVRDQAFQEVVNSTDVFSMEIAGGAGRGVSNVESRCPQLLANYSDLLLRRSAKHLSSEEVDEKLNNLLLVLKYVRNKDVFMRYYKTNLSHRLIFEMVTDQDREEQLVARFREAGMPADFVHKLARMLMDMEMSSSLCEELKELKRSVPHPAAGAGPDSTPGSIQQLVSVKVLNAGAWSRTAGGSSSSGAVSGGGAPGYARHASSETPSAQHHGLALPADLDEYMCEVENYYRKKYSGRKLNWAHHWSTGTITFANEMGRYELKVTAHQLAILLTWNARPHDKISYEQLRLTSGLSDVELSRALTSMVANAKLPNAVLLTDYDKLDDGKSATVEGSQLALPRFQNSTLFWLNQKFCVAKGERTQPRGKISLIGRLQLSQAQESAGGGGEAHQQEHEEIRQLRELRIQEAIVKIMKMRRQATQAQLHTELVDVLKSIFLPSKRLIKEQIEWLFDKGYLRRHPDDINTFIYCT